MSEKYNTERSRRYKQRHESDTKKHLQTHGIKRHIKIILHRTEGNKTENKIKNEDWYKCPHSTCTFRSKAPTKVKKHVSLKHNSKTPQCSSCGKHFASEKSLQLHNARMHSDSKQKMFPCNYANCSFSSNEKRKLTQYVMVHEGQNPHKCSFCGWSSRQKVHLKKHMETWHESQLQIGSTESRITKREKNYKCPTCDYSCYTPAKLKIHDRVHTGHKPFKCTICNYSAKQNSHLTMHLKAHSGLKPHSCKLCNYKCISISTLTSHMRTHTREEPYACPHCPYTCSFDGSLTVHTRIHTQEKPFECSQCDYTSHGQAKT